MVVYPIADIDAEKIAEIIKEHAHNSITEEDIKVKVAHVLRDEVLDRFNIPWEQYEYTLLTGLRTDALYGKVIIEYERPGTFETEKGFDKAVKQVKQYISDLAGSEEHYTEFFGVVLDGFKIGFVRYRLKIKNWDVKGAYDVNRSSIFTLLEAIRGLSKKPLDADHLAQEFGPESKVARLIVAAFYEKLLSPKSEKTKMLFAEWKRVYSHVCSYSPEKLKDIGKFYGIEKADAEILFFAIHSYYALLMKLLSAEVATLYTDSLLWSYLKKLEDAHLKSPEALKLELLDLEEGGIFAKLGITNFLEADYFLWYLDEWDKNVEDSVVEVIRSLAEYEPATTEHDPHVIKDLFKDLYENLVPSDIRHNLGEYYTPDWFAELLISKIGLNIKDLEKWKNKDVAGIPELRILDPACGSGTFLVEAIAKISEYVDEHYIDKGHALERITNDIVGFDLNPLAVLTARANYLLALGRGNFLRHRKGKIEIPVYLADSVFIEKRRMVEVNEDVYVLKTVVKDFLIPASIVKSGTLAEILSVIKEYLASKSSVEALKKSLEGKLTASEIEIIGKLYEKIIKLEQQGKNSIWTSIIKNTFAPFLKGKFDFVVGNPPWLSYIYVGGVEYQAALKKMISEDYALTKEAANIANMELAALFFVRASDLYLKDNGLIAFIMPRSILTADQHNAFRRSEIKNVKIGLIEIFDVKGVKPLFNVPACGICGIKGKKTRYPIKAFKMKGNLPKKNLGLEEALTHLETQETKYHLYELGARSWLDDYNKDLVEFCRSAIGKRSDYYDKFLRGADIIPRSIWFVDIIANSLLGLNREKPYVETSKKATLMGKQDYNDLVMKGNVEADFLYAVVTSSELVPFGNLPLPTAVLPIKPVGEKYFLIQSYSAIEKGFVGLGKWLKKAEEEWNRRRGEKAKRLSIYEWIDYRHKLINQNPRKRFKVLYPTSATYIVSCVLDSQNKKDLTINLNINIERKGIIVDTKAYFMETDNENEAFYLCSVLNSKFIDDAIKPMQSRGSWGPRDIHKKVLELPVPKYNKENKIHNKLSELGKEAANKVANKLPLILDNYGGATTTPQIVGRIRNDVRDEINDILLDIDAVVIDMFKKSSKNLKNNSLAGYTNE